MGEKSREQNLIDIIWRLTVSAKLNADWYKFTDMPNIIQHVRKQLALDGFYTNPIGSNWGVLVDKDEYDETIIP